MAVERIGSLENRFIGLSTDTKPTTNTQNGGTFFEFNTGFMWIYNGYAWVPKSYMPETTINYKQISLAQAAGDYSVMTATTQALFIDAVIIHVPDDLSAVATFASIKVATDTPVVLLSAANGAKAKLTGNFYYVYTGPIVTPATDILEVTIGGGAAPANSVVDITVLWRPLVAGGYYLNA